MTRRWEILDSPVWRWGRWCLLGFGLLRLGFWLLAFPNPDEAYYWLWGQRPGFSYYDHPPFHAWVQGLFSLIDRALPGAGPSLLVLRLPNLVSGGILAFTFYHICRYLYRDQGRDRFWLVVLLGLSSPLYFWYLGLAWNDHWLVTWAVVSSFLFVRYVDASVEKPGSGRSQDLYGAAFTLGLAGLCKYNALFVGLGFLALLVSDRRRWGLWRDRRLYLALAILALTLSPILIWNIQNDFFSFRFYRDRTAGGGPSLNLLQPLVFLTLCGLTLGPIQSWGIGRLIQHQVQQRLTQRGEAALQRPSCYATLALWIFGLSTAAFTALSAVSTALFYWNILAYPLLLPLLSDRFYRPGRLVRRGQLAIAQGLGLFVAAVLVVYYTVMPLGAWFGAVDPDGAALFGWPQVAQAVRTEADRLENPLLLTTDYRSAAALAYSLNDPSVLAISGRIDQFDFWYDAPALEGRDAVLLGETWHPICPAHLAMFERVEPAATVPVQRFGRVLQTYTIIRGYGFKAGPEGYPLSPDYPLAFTTDGERCQP